MNIGAKLKELRVQKGLTQEELADRAELTGAVSPAEVTAYLHRMDIGCAPYPAGGSPQSSSARS